MKNVRPLPSGPDGVEQEAAAELDIAETFPRESSTYNDGKVKVSGTIKFRVRARVRQE